MTIRSWSTSTWPPSSSSAWLPFGVEKPELDDLPLDEPLDQLARGALRDDLRLVHDHEPIAELLRLVHVVRREDERHALLLEAVEAVPERVPRLRVEAGGRLVEEHQLAAS